MVIIIIVLVALNIRPSASSQKVTLTVWGFDSQDVMKNLTEGYKKLRPNVTVNYVQVVEENYKERLLNALAAGQGPDVFVIWNHDLPSEKDKILPVTAYPQLFDLVKFRSLFPTAVEQDFVSGGQIYALPLYLDTLSLIYNKDFFDQAAIVSPPKTWDEFQRDISKLRNINPKGQIVRAAAAIGGSEDTVDAGADLLELLMLQNGAKMTDPDFTYATFDTGSRGDNPGLAAFNFYLQFANAASPYYTWNDGQTNSLDSFAGGKTAMIFNYHAAVAAIKSKSPFLNFAVALVPQPAGADLRVDFPEYYGFAVSKQSAASNWAWDFVLYVTTYPEVSRVYLDGAGRPPALRSLINDYLANPDYSVFAKQALTARSWYEVDGAKIRNIMSSAVKSVLTGLADSETALGQAQGQITQLMKPNL